MPSSRTAGSYESSLCDVSEIFKSFFQRLNHGTIPLTVKKNPYFYIPPVLFICDLFLYINILVGMRRYFILICIYLLINAIMNIFVCLLTIYLPFLKNVCSSCHSILCCLLDLLCFESTLYQ